MTPTNKVSTTTLFSVMDFKDLVFIIETGLNYKTRNESNPYLNGHAILYQYHLNPAIDMLKKPNLK